MPEKSEHTGQDAAEPQYKAVLGMVLVSAFAVPITLSASNVALPHIGRALHLDAVVLSWIPMAYLSGSAMFVLIFGRLADMYGRKRIFLCGTLLVVASSIYAASANSGGILLLARFLQGISVAMLYATQMALISAVAPPQRRGHFIGMATAMIYLGLSIGPLLGGFATDRFGWRAAFLVHLPLAVAVLLIGILRVSGEWKAAQRGSYDIPGTLLYMLGIASFSCGLGGLPSVWAWPLLLAGLGCGIGFLLYEHRHANPLLDVRLFFSNRLFALSNMAAWFVYVSIYSNVVLAALFLQYLQGLSATTAGLIMMSQPISQSVVSLFSGHLSDRLAQPRTLCSVGLILCSSGLLLLGQTGADEPSWHITLALIVTGIGVGLFTSPNSNAIMGSVSRQHLGVAAACISIVRLLGQLGSMAVVTCLFALLLGRAEIGPANYPELERAIRICYLIAASLCVPALYCSLTRGKTAI